MSDSNRNSISCFEGFVKMKTSFEVWTADVDWNQAPEPESYTIDSGGPGEAHAPIVAAVWMAMLLLPQGSMVQDEWKGEVMGGGCHLTPPRNLLGTPLYSRGS